MRSFLAPTTSPQTRERPVALSFSELQKLILVHLIEGTLIEGTATGHYLYSFSWLKPDPHFDDSLCEMAVSHVQHV